MRYILRMYIYVVVISVGYLILLLTWFNFIKTNITFNTRGYVTETVGSEDLFERAGKLPNWNSRSLLSNTTDKSLIVFRQTLTQKEFSILKDTLKVLKYACESNNLTYMLYGGSLLGAYRHAGLIPWDDDIDIWMDQRQTTKADTILSQIPGYGLHHVKGDKTLWKLYSDLTRQNKSVSKLTARAMFPYIHILFFVDNSTHVKHSDGVVTQRTAFPRADIFPLQKMMFEDEELFVPSKVNAVIKRKYGQTNTCTARDPKTQKDGISVSCDRLRPYYPFIERTHNDTAITLTFGGKVIWRKGLQ